MSTGMLLGAAVLLTTIGMAVAFVGILVPALFLPGTWIILAGSLGCAAAGVLAIARPQSDTAT